MNPSLKNLVQRLTNLDKKAEVLDKALQNVRLEINNVLWDFIELKRSKEKKA